MNERLPDHRDDDHLLPAWTQEDVLNLEARLRRINGDPPVTHTCPAWGASTMPCCGKTPFEVPRTDRMTTVASRVTCGGPRT